ncbi:TPA: hypothetical protein I3599_000525 [Enterobacter cloacae]|nr:hypothetical protein [Enterobacter cloacae]
MDIKEIRKQRLTEWFENRPIPREESSYISQLIKGRASFGERAARRLESTYDMPEHYLDEPYEEVAQEQTQGIKDMDFRQLKLVELAKSLPDSEVDDIILMMEEKKKFYEARIEELFAKYGIKKP